MAEHLTKKCGAAGHPEIQVSVVDESSLSPSWLCEYFESEVLKGRLFRSGETVQVGWMVTQLKEGSSGILEIWEPDFDSMPIKWCRGANNTLRHLMIQRAVCKEIGCEPRFASLQEAAVVGGDFLDSVDGFIMSRKTPVGADTGWLFRPLEVDGLEGEFKSLYEIALHRPCVIPFLALPVGAAVKWSKQVIEVSFEKKRITSHESDVLRRIAETTIFV